MKTFAEVFKKYRLRSEFETFAAFSNALSEKGYHYDESIFSHWQKGTRVPSSRHLLLKILEIFIEKEAITKLDQANEFLSSAGMGYLTEEEKTSLPFHLLSSALFQVPSEIAHFTGREEIIKQIEKEITNGKIFLLYGPPGVGKTALAIKLGHLLKPKFPDGVLWYKVDSSNVMDILLSIAQLFGEDISKIKDVEVRASIVRTLVSKKKLLLILDNVRAQDKLHLLVPNNASCAVIFSSQESLFNLSTDYTVIPVNVFTEREVLRLFNSFFNKQYIEKNKKTILAIGSKMGNLPLAVHVVAAHTKKLKLKLESYLKLLDKEEIDLKSLTYEDRNLFKAITISFNTLSEQTKDIFISLGVFEGKDFSLDAVSFINKLQSSETYKAFKQLQDLSIIEFADKKRYRIHPLMRLFAREKMQNTSNYLRAALYYEQLLNAAQEKHSYKLLMQDVDNIIYVFKKCYESGYWDQIITLWNPIEKFLSNINETKKLRHLAQTIDTVPSINKVQKILTAYMILMLLYWFILFFSGEKASVWNYIFGALWVVIPFMGGVIGMIRSKSWGLFQTNIGKALFFISAGLVSWSSSNPLWVYYNLWEKIEVPYPSLTDVGFVGAGICWIIGIIYLSKATGAKFTLKKKRNKLFLLVIPLIIMTISYYFLLIFINRTLASEEPLKMFLDLAYPTMDVIILSLACIILGLSVNFFRGKYKVSLFAMLSGFVGLYIADFLFAYTTSIGIYYNGGPLELLFCIALYLITLGTMSFYLTQKKH